MEKEYGGISLITQPYPRASLTVTRAGQVLYEQAQDVLGQLQTTRTEVVHAAEDSIRLGLSPVTGVTWFPKVANKLLKTNLLADLVVHEAGSQQLLSELTSGQIDVALLATVSPLKSQDLNAMLLAIHPFKIIVSAHHRLAQQEAVAFSDLRDDPFVTMTNHYIHAQALEAYSSAGQFRPNVVYRTSDLSMVKALVRQNVGVSLLVETAVNQGDAGITALALTDVPPTLSYMYLVTRHSFHPTKRQAFFIQLFRDQAQS
ncbi:LysR substrate-binding domain-containing protein [Secundilactobacillus paracollinoides]|uniref:LysR substrate-binding domain-containing protein n=1 Tax=Secundilactobacillus paracollinoides TaxID=240427 RepID=UPI00138F681A|nr:LysR substrate-binding domain-containing protein [Secundilactobacillus paracollinoides]